MRILFVLPVLLWGCADEARQLNPGAATPWKLVHAADLHVVMERGQGRALGACDGREIREALGYDEEWLVCHEFCLVLLRFGLLLDQFPQFSPVSCQTQRIQSGKSIGRRWNGSPAVHSVMAITGERLASALGWRRYSMEKF